MFQDYAKGNLKPDEFAALGTDVVAYMRSITAEEIAVAFPNAPELETNQKYWALFAANGEPLMLADQATEVVSSAFYNDLRAVLPN